MALTRAKSGDVIDICPLGPALATARTAALVKTDRLEIIRLVIPAGKVIPGHQVAGEATIQCLEGQIALTIGDKTHELQAGQLVYLAGKEPHSVRGICDASVLVTILLR